MSDEEKEGKWEKVKRSVSKGMSQAKAKWQEIKAEMQEDSNKPSKQYYGYNADTQTAHDLKKQTLSQKKCPFCQTLVAPELLSQFAEKGFIVCEICGTEIK
jgi:hypothetical protein